MSPEAGLTRLPAPHRTRHATAAPVLIQVPTLRTARGRPRSPGSTRRRRRLRREIRVGGTALLLGMPATWGVLTLVGSASGVADAPITPPVVSLSTELEPVASGPDVEVPRVLPSGYLLPDPNEDATEETAHAGT